VRFSEHFQRRKTHTLGLSNPLIKGTGRAEGWVGGLLEV
jgi:hypothetical protein